MKAPKDDKIVELLKQSVRPSESALPRDLWPQMLGRLQQRSPAVPWFDWALLAALALWLCFAPSAIPLLFYHL